MSGIFHGWNETITLFTPQFAQSYNHLQPSSLISKSMSLSNLVKSSSRIKILKALVGTNWGKQKETMLITYMSVIRFLFMSAAPIWFLNTSPSYIQKLQIIQDSVFRIATGFVKMTSIDLLQEDTKMLPIQDHLSLIFSQYLANLTTIFTV